jgi:hypothetical protein
VHAAVNCRVCELATALLYLLVDIIIIIIIIIYSHSIDPNSVTKLMDMEIIQKGHKKFEYI